MLEACRLNLFYVYPGKLQIEFTIKSGWSIVIISIKNAFLSLNIDFVFPNSADPDKIPHYAAFHLGLHCLLKYTYLWVSGLQWVIAIYADMPLCETGIQKIEEIKFIKIEYPVFWYCNWNCKGVVTKIVSVDAI